MDSVKCYICNVFCAATYNKTGSSITRTLTVPLTAVLASCLPIVDDIDTEYFCVNCTNQIEEYDDLVRQSRQIENDLYEKFLNKSLKCEMEEEPVIIIDRDKINEVLIQTVEEIKIPLSDGANTTTNSVQQVQGDKVQPLGRTEVKMLNVKKIETNSKLVARTPNYKIERVSCDICGKTYKSKGALGVHMVQHGAKSPHGKVTCMQ